MDTFKIWFDNPGERQISDICNRLEKGEIGIIPTDSLYGICCDALNTKGINKICALKGINPDKTNLSIICSDISMAAEYARIENNAYLLIRDNTPGPFTFLLRAANTLPKAFKERKIVGIRIPDNETDRKIVEFLGHPLLTTSIEFPDDDYARNPELIAENYKYRVDFFVEGEDGDTIPTTIIDCTEDPIQIIRQGKGEL